MSNVARLQLRTEPPPEPRLVRRPQERYVEVTVTADDRVLLDVRDAAARLGIGRSSLYELIAAGQIRTITIGRLRKVPVVSLDEFIATRLASQAPDLSTTA